MRRQAFDVLVVGPVVLDHLFASKEASVGYGQTVDVKEVPVTMAGHGANVAVALARLGVKVGLVSAVGRDARGDQILAALAKEGIETGLVSRVSLAETALGVTVLPPPGKKEPLVLRAPGAADLIEISEEVQKMLHTTQWLYAAPLSGAWEPQAKLLLDALGREQTRLVWHPGHLAGAEAGDLFAQLLERTEVLFVNAKEAQALAGEGGGHDALERGFRRRGVNTVVLTQGAEVAHVLTGNLHLAAKPPAGPSAADPRGAGDAFRAAFVAGLMASNDAVTALQWALVNAASVVGSPTTQKGLLSRSVLEARLKNLRLGVEKTSAKG